MSITKYDDVIDSRDVIERIEELASDLADAMNDELDDADYDSESIKEENYEKLKNTLMSCWHSDIEEMFSLMQFADECEQCSSDWEHGETLIRYSYFKDYVMEMLEDCGDIPRNLSWYVADAIDWNKVADNIGVDYSVVDWDDVSFYIRNS